MAPLRLQLEPPAARSAAGQAITVHIAKRRGGWAVPNLQVSFTSHVPRPEPEVVQAQLELWRTERSPQEQTGLPMWSQPDQLPRSQDRVH